MEHKVIIADKHVEPVEVSPIEREKLQKYCNFFELSLPHLLGEELPQIADAKKYLTMFSSRSKPETALDHSRKNIEQLGLTKTDWLNLAKKHYGLLHTKPETIASYLHELADTFASDDITYDAAKGIFLSQPRMLSTPVVFINQNIDEITRRYAGRGVSRVKFIKASRKQTSLLTTSAELKVPKLDAIIDAEEKGIIRYPLREDGTYGDLGDFIVDKPAVLTASLKKIEIGIGLCMARFEKTGQPYLSIPVQERDQQTARNTLAQIASRPRPIRSLSGYRAHL